jgi:hypothetical protein
MADLTASAAAAFESGRTISGPTAIQLNSTAEYELTVSKSGYGSERLLLGEVPLSRVTAWDFFFSPLLFTRLFTWVVMVPWYRIIRPRRIVLRGGGTGADRRRVSIKVALRNTGAETTLALVPDEAVDVQVVRMT